ncbi:NAD(P)-binding domain-containing protein [Mesorhizobium sp. M0491]
MGSALAGSLLQSGYPTTVWNRTRQKTDPLARLGAIAASSVEEAVNAGEIIIVNVSDYKATKALLHSGRHRLSHSRQADRGVDFGDAEWRTGSR